MNSMVLWESRSGGDGILLSPVLPKAAASQHSVPAGLCPPQWEPVVPGVATSSGIIPIPSPEAAQHPQVWIAAGARRRVSPQPPLGGTERSLCQSRGCREWMQRGRRDCGATERSLTLGDPLRWWEVGTGMGTDRLGKPRYRGSSTGCGDRWDAAGWDGWMGCGRMGSMNGWMEGWVDGGMGGWVDGWVVRGLQVPPLPGAQTIARAPVAAADCLFKPLTSPQVALSPPWSSMTSSGGRDGEEEEGGEKRDPPPQQKSPSAHGNRLQMSLRISGRGRHPRVAQRGRGCHPRVAQGAPRPGSCTGSALRKGRESLGRG